MKTKLSPSVLTLLFTIVRLTARASARPWTPNPIQGRVNHRSASGTTDDWFFQIPSAVQNGTSTARFNISTPGSVLSTETLLSLDSPQLDFVNASVFDWWYFDAVSDSNPAESLVVTLFTSTAEAFPFLNPNETSVLIAYVWASFANGSTYADYVPASWATVAGGAAAQYPSEGGWDSTRLRWTAAKEDLSQYEVVISSDVLHIDGTLSLTSGLSAHLPCGIQPDVTTLEIAPHLGWASVTPDAAGSVNITIQGTHLAFQGPAYHDKNWSDQPFMDSVRSWYWGHGRVGPYSIVWFSYLALNDPSSTSAVSSYVAKDGQVLVSGCASSGLTVCPYGNDSAGSTGSRYPPHVGDVPAGFRLEFDLGSDEWLVVNVTAGEVVAGDGQYYMRWTGGLAGEVVQRQTGMPEACGSSGPVAVPEMGSASLTGVRVFEQFALVV